MTGEDGVRLAREHKPDLVLMDIQLPGINGIDGAAPDSRRPGADAIPVMAVSASVMPDEQQKIIDAGLRRLHRQADQLKEFLDMVQRLLASGRQGVP